ncbi:MAG TPA: aminoglycoside 6-adenylyltransferase [Ktedonobacterales bacterium]|jgi:aminoglycoside 6-adenylyltransferase
MLPADETQPAYEALIARMAAWAADEPDIRAALIVGSRARSERPADVWSDLDLVFFARDPERYLRQTEWIAGFGEVWLTFLEPTAAGGGTERRVLYAGGLDVDFSVFPLAAVAALSDDAEARGVLARGVRVVLDKDGLAAQLTAGHPPPAPPRLPAAATIEHDAQDFWYHALWTAKKLRRGELWTAKMCCDGHLKWLLLRLLEWHARATAHATTSAPADTWHAGRFADAWADPRALAALRGAFARYDSDDIWRALAATMDLYRWLALELAERVSYAYPAEADRQVTALIHELAAGR